MTERELQAEVVRLVEAGGGLWYHAESPRKDPPGFPDLTIVMPGDEAIFAELKSDTGRLRPEQVAWQRALTASRSRYYIWRPEHLESGEIERQLGMESGEPLTDHDAGQAGQGRARARGDDDGAVQRRIDPALLAEARRYGPAAVTALLEDERRRTGEGR
jgi:hypothetical protein